MTFERVTVLPAPGVNFPKIKGRPWPPLIECKGLLHWADLPNHPGAGDLDQRTIGRRAHEV